MSIFSGSSVIAEYDNGAAPSSPSREYIYNPAGGSTTGLLAIISGGATTYFHQDDLSVRLTTDSSGSVVTQEGTFPFGEQWYESGPSNNWFFTSYDRDSESGLDYALARYYDSRTGTFCSADPLAGDPSDPQSWNRYPYGRNDPIDITDPSGQSWWGWLIAGALAPFTSGGSLEAYAEWEGGVAWMEGKTPLPFLPFSFSGGVPSGTSWNGTPIYLPNRGLAGALGLPTMADVGPIFDATKEEEVQENALQEKNLVPCAKQFFGPNFKFTMSNLPHIGATHDLPGAAAGQTRAEMVPTYGRPTVLIDKGIYTMKPNDPFLVNTYLHETANAYAIQRFTQWEPRWARAWLGPRGTLPSKHQISPEEWDHDIGQQFEECLTK